MQRSAVDKREQAEGLSVNPILMFKPYADNKARMDYITQTHGNEAGWYPLVGRPFEMKYSSHVTM